MGNWYEFYTAVCLVETCLMTMDSFYCSIPVLFSVSSCPSAAILFTSIKCPLKQVGHHLIFGTEMDALF